MVAGCSALYAYDEGEEVFKPEGGDKGPSDGDRVNDQIDREEQQAEQLRLEREREHNLKTDFYDSRDINAQALKEVPSFQESDSDQDGNLIDSSTVELSRDQAVRDLELQAIERSCRDMILTRKKSVEGLAGKKEGGFAHTRITAVNAQIESITSQVSNSKELINQNKQARIKVKSLMDEATALGKKIDILLTDGETRKDVFGRRLQKDMNTIDEKLKKLADVREKLQSIVRDLYKAQDKARQEKELIDREIRHLSERAQQGFDDGAIDRFIEVNERSLTSEEITQLEKKAEYSRTVRARKEELDKESSDKIGQMYQDAEENGADPVVMT